jgi:hypothetical protein
MRALFDRRSRAAACRQGAREASELNPTLSASKKTEPLYRSYVLLPPIVGETSRCSLFGVVSLVILLLNGFDRGHSGENAA